MIPNKPLDFQKGQLTFQLESYLRCNAWWNVTLAHFSLVVSWLCTWIIIVTPLNEYTEISWNQGI